MCTEEKQIPRCARDGILGALSFRAKRSGARNLLLVAPLGRAVLCVRLEKDRGH